MAEQNVTQIATPSETIRVDRKTAAAINPLIGDLSIRDTLEGTKAVVYELGFIVGDTDLARGSLFRVFQAVSAALDWELKNMEACHD